MTRPTTPRGIPSAFGAIVNRQAALLGLFCLLLAVYLVVIRPSQLRWGATTEDIARAMPDDGIVAHPVFDATRAITIHARPEEIWPWLAQMGYRRAGFYGYDLIENIGNGSSIASARTILPALQHPNPGDPLPISAVASARFDLVVPNQYVVWRDPHEPPHGVFIWALVPIDASHTRLISRIRLSPQSNPGLLVLDLFTEFFDHVAVPKILVGIRDRIEGRPLQSLTSEAIEIGAWFLALFEFVIAAALVLRRRRWGSAWLLALGAGVLLQIVLYAHMSVWAEAPLPCIYLAVMVWFCRWERVPKRNQIPLQPVV